MIPFGPRFRRGAQYPIAYLGGGGYMDRRLG